MRLVSGLAHPEEIVMLAAAGVGEFYCGVTGKEWIGNDISRYPPNRRGQDTANFKSFQELEVAVKKAHQYKIITSLVLNAVCLDNACIKRMEQYIKDALACGIDAFIVPDMAVAQLVKHVTSDCRIVLSTVASTYNSYAIRFYQDRGIHCVIMPRHLTIEEIRKIREANTDVELEVFIMNVRCPNDDGYCSADHRLNKMSDAAGCLFFRSYNIDVTLNKGSSSISSSQLRLLQQRFREIPFSFNACGACAIYYFNKMKIDAIKIVGREFRPCKRLKHARYVRKCIEFAETHPEIEYEAYQNSIRSLYFETFGHECTADQCYYP
jgi:collagenase-like PrtC family protease